MTRNIKKILIAVVALSLAVGACVIYAVSDASSKVIFDVATRRFRFVNGVRRADGIHLFDIDHIMPGDEFTTTVNIEVRNIGDNTVKMYFQATDPDDNYKSIFGTPTSRDEDETTPGTQTTAEDYIGTFNSNTSSGSYNINFSVPTSVGNKFQKAVSKIKWTFYAEVIEPTTPPTPPTPPRPDDSDSFYLADIESGKVNTSSISTGDKILTSEGYTLNVTKRRSDGSLVLQFVENKEEKASVLRLNVGDHFKYVVGYPDGTVRPMGNIIRAEVAEIFYRCLTDKCREYYECVQNTFLDVPSNTWYNTSVSTLANMGVIEGYPDGTFRPYDEITREEFAAICAKFFAYIDGETHPFEDVKGRWSETQISIMYALGYIEGYPDGSYKPLNKITRAEAFTIMNNMLFRHPKTEEILKDTKQWPDNQDKTTWYYAQVQEASDSHYQDLILTKESNLYEEWTEIYEDTIPGEGAQWTLRDYTTPSN